jgi:glucosamine-6-phosphate deaminase
LLQVHGCQKPPAEVRKRFWRLESFLGAGVPAGYNLSMSDATGLVREFHAGDARVAVYRSAASAGAAAAVQAARLIRSAIAKQGRARVIGATGNSQIPLVDVLVKENIDWEAVELFHMDEYVGIKEDHPSSFRYWIMTRLEEKVHPGMTHYLNGDAGDLGGEIIRYTQLLTEAPIDVAFVGFGENGHIAFNDPPAADFNDPAMVKVVVLDEACRRQQAGEGHFFDVTAVPKEAITITCSGLFRAKAWICCVPENRKAEAVRNALEGPVLEGCPASLVRRHPDAYVYLDSGSASRLSMVEVSAGSEA